MTNTFVFVLFGALIITFALGMMLGVCLTFGRPRRNRTIAVEIISNGAADLKAFPIERKVAPEVRRPEARPERTPEPKPEGKRERTGETSYERFSNIASRGRWRMAMAIRVARSVHK